MSNYIFRVFFFRKKNPKPNPREALTKSLAVSLFKTGKDWCQYDPVTHNPRKKGPKGVFQIFESQTTYRYNVKSDNKYTFFV